MRKIDLFICVAAIFVFTGCTNEKHKVKDPNLQIIISDAQSAEFNFQKDEHVIFYLADKPLHIRLDLSSKEKADIINKYYDLDLDELGATTSFEDKCMVMPKLYTALQVESTAINQHIVIDEACSDFPLNEAARAAKIKKFLAFIWNIIRERPAVKNAPRSDIMYL